MDDIRKQKQLKMRLIALSLAPLCFLTMILNCKFICKDEINGEWLTASEFIWQNICLIVVMCFLGLLLMYCLFSCLYFKFFISFDAKGGYTVENITKNKEAGINFFLTMIVPLLIDGLNQPQNALVFFIVAGIIARLLYVTNLYYANPILTILGYNVYNFSFTEHAHFSADQVMTAIVAGDLNENEPFSYKLIVDDILYVKPRR